LKREKTPLFNGVGPVAIPKTRAELGLKTFIHEGMDKCSYISGGKGGGKTLKKEREKKKEKRKMKEET
jgi:hypothetical protein